MRRLFTYPNPVSEGSSRVIALGVVTMAVAAEVLRLPVLLIPLTYGFCARVAAGPTLSPLGLLASRVVGPRIVRWRRPVPGPPKRFSQGIGAVLTVSATLAWLTVGWGVARWILLPLVVAAGLEGLAGYCVGCAIFGFLIRWGVVPASVCAECSDLSARWATRP
ncbi:MAG: DUF4395 domain-containing protein [Acidimicrobiales bacterium]